MVFRKLTKQEFYGVAYNIMWHVFDFIDDGPEYYFCETLGVFINDELAGCILFDFIKNNGIKENYVITATKFQGLGYGKLLQEELIKLGQETCDFILVYPADDSLVPFYKKCGFEEIENSREMRLDLTKKRSKYFPLA